MRTARILIVSAALIVAGAEPTLAAPRAGHQQSNAAISPALTGLLGQFPKGGAGLTRAIEAILDENPANAGSIVGLAKLGNPNQKAAIALGILHVLHRLDPSSELGAHHSHCSAGRRSGVQRDFFSSGDAVLRPEWRAGRRAAWWILFRQHRRRRVYRGNRRRAAIFRQSQLNVRHFWVGWIAHTRRLCGSGRSSPLVAVPPLRVFDTEGINSVGLLSEMTS